MAKVYTTSNDLNDKNSQLATVAYVNEVSKAIKDSLITHVTNNYDFKIKDPDIEQFPEKEIDLSSISAENIIEDSNHKFITDEELKLIKNKPSEIDVTNMINNTKKELLDHISKEFDLIFNNIDCLDKIKELLHILSSNIMSNTIIETLSTKASKEDLNKHKDSIYHLTDEDRESLNKIISIIKSGGIDWNAEKSQPNSIKNKPEFLPAEGGDADSISGYGIESILNHQIENFIVGDANANDYINDEVDILLKSEKDTQHFFDMIKNNGIYSFRKGTYKCNNIKFNNDGNIIINGVGNMNTEFNGIDIYLDANTSFNDICFDHCNLYIGVNCNINNCNFLNCEITLNRSINCTISNCNFSDTLFMFSGSCFNNIITCNRFFKCAVPSYSGGNNLINNNIGCY